MNPSSLHQRTSIIFALLAAMLLGTSFFTGCQTVKGAGKDIEKAGDKIQDSADKHS
jgi:predicted small secreted protein